MDVACAAHDIEPVFLVLVAQLDEAAKLAELLLLALVVVNLRGLLAGCGIRHRNSKIIERGFGVGFLLEAVIDILRVFRVDRCRSSRLQ